MTAHRYRLLCTRRPCPRQWTFMQEWHRTLESALAGLAAHQQQTWDSITLTPFQLHVGEGGKIALAMGQQGHVTWRVE